MSLLIQIAGSVLIVAAFAASQIGSAGKSSRAYLAANAIGSFALGSSALLSAQWGFLALEGIWCAVSAFGLYKTVSVSRAERDGSGAPSPASSDSDLNQTISKG